MKNLLLLLLLANVLYFMWGQFTNEDPVSGVVIVEETTLGPTLDVSRSSSGQTAAAAGAFLEAAKPSDLAAVVGHSCVSIGPFRSQDEAESVSGEFRDQGMRVNARSTQGEIFVGHWVQIRHVANRATGNQILQELSEGGLADAYLVPTDDEGLKISLGLFGDIDRAERVELQAKSMDFPAEISPRMREATLFFVDIALPPGRGAGAIIEKYGEDQVRLRADAICPRSE